MKFSKFLLVYIFLSLTTLNLKAQRVITEVVAEKSQINSKKLGVAKISGDTTCIRVTQNIDSLQQGGEVVITVTGCQDLVLIKVLISGISAEINDKGGAKLKSSSGMIGTHSIPVSIVYRDKEGNLKKESYTATYKVWKALSQ